MNMILRALDVGADEPMLIPADYGMPDGFLHAVTLSKATVRPKINLGNMAAVMSQLQPEKLAGYHPEQCVNVSEMEGDE